MIDGLFRHRGGLLAAVALAALLSAPPATDRLGSAALLAGAGLALRLWAIRHIGGAARTRDTRAPRSRVVSGPYGVVAHPLYLANILLVVALVLTLDATPRLRTSLVLIGLGFYATLAWREQRVVRQLPTRPGAGLGLGRALRVERGTWWAAALVLGLQWGRGLF